jgi:hypothetical protein
MIKIQRARVSRALLGLFEARSNAFFARLASRMNLALILDLVLDSYYKRTSRFITWELSAIPFETNRTPISFSSLNLERKLKAKKSIDFPNPFGSELCIVIQGQIISKNFLTRNIVNYYLTNFSDVKVILSTWSNTSKIDLAAFEIFKANFRFKLVLTDPPKSPGVFNVNNQIISAREGLRPALEMSEFSIKTRTDQLLSSPMLLKNLHVTWNAHRLNKESKNRIVISSLNTFAFRFYGASDMFQFGRTQDLFSFWNQELDGRPHSELTKLSKSMRQEGKKLVAEVYLNTNYFEKVMGKPPVFSWKENIEFLKESFIIVDQHSLGQIWVKNTHLANRWDFGFFPHKYYEFSHLDWIGLILDSKEWLDQEHLVDSEDFYSHE